jgi:hypothetical protein
MSLQKSPFPLGTTEIMENKMEKNNDAYKVAEEKVEARIMLYKHLAAFITVNLLLCLINLICSGSISWALWPILGWGMVVVIHASYIVFHTQGLKENMIKKELEKEEKQKKVVK